MRLPAQAAEFPLHQARAPSVCIHIDQAPTGIALSGNRLYVSSFFSSKVTWIDTSRNRIAGTIAVGFEPVGVAMDPSEAIRSPCADLNGDETVNVSDAIYLLTNVFLGGPDPICRR